MKTISQSLLRDMLSQDGYCAHYLNLVYNSNYKTELSNAMLMGLVFEQAILGSTRDGEHVELPRLKSGEKSADEKRLDGTIEFAKSVLAANEIIFTATQLHIENGLLHGHPDAVGTYHGMNYTFDLKWTGMSFDQWERELKYSSIRDHFAIQARHYQSLMDDPMPFMFLVFGDNWARFFEVPFDGRAIEHHKEVAAEALDVFNSMEYTPTSDSRLCFECRLAWVCDKRNQTIQIETL